MQISEKSKQMELSPIRRFNEMARDAENRGIKIYRVNIGQPDIKTPECYMEAVRNYPDDVIAYMESGGTDDLREAVSDYYASFGDDFAPDEIMITSGGSEALSMVFTTILNEGDEVLVADPYYSNYSTFVLSAGGQIARIPTHAEEGYHFAYRERIEQAITPRTKAICCTSPGNPTGDVLTQDEMHMICEIAEEHDLWIVSDEVYREFVYDGGAVASFGREKEYLDRIIITDSISKRYSCCGGRIGILISKNRDVMNGAMKLAQGRLSVSTLDQAGAAALFRLPTSYYDEIRDEYEKRRDIVYSELTKIPGVVCVKPRGSFYVTVKLPVDDIEDFLVFLLTEFEDKKETVMFAPADGFYYDSERGKNKMRLAYVLEGEQMRRSVELIRLGLEAYEKKQAEN
ncbi:MAG: pyridoxal phosphate-dependent aminotransferase [Eubacterium sp.]|nr:pyridoxal phosphate-dependent aminotransferase [Eubacterium sp.]